ncbi:hypothetical protein BX616_003309 [Lobosporangium transversale]|uniref:Uncharacterized protein n=1 Tax=Lobosporangium transversale TaxID=64571 RepID=A0A1Y2GYQ6_9FUNG|nr:hypothetical protein BCR41DRAFT_392732 [Lobosporangium transversale]KAF9899071.1 hypothetical protein BX616_003309 [Lobosporangium transversale]ORZ27406.1 hypothetical protein BCR41DRAFT_392732 [Lobosporangium transversale]|eukprot:XP_021885133.1 hypothetical protein BCR41DRAFT_392732 [Lobosporangium transversale]
MKEKEPTIKLIQDIKEGLERIKVFLDQSLKWVDDYLNKSVVSHYAITTSELKAPTTDFLGIVAHFFKEELPGLYKVVDQIRDLMTCYEHTFEVFVGEAETILSLQGLTNMAQSLQRAHEEAANGYTAICHKAKELMDKYEAASRGYTATHKLFKLASFGLTICSCATVLRLALPERAANMLIGSTVVLSAGVGRQFCELKAEVCQTKATAYDQEVTKLQKLIDNNKEFEKPISAISEESDACMVSLAELRHLSKPLIGEKYEEGDKKEEYEAAKSKAKAIKQLCDSIRCHPYQISKLKMTAEFKMKQIAEAASVAI